MSEKEERAAARAAQLRGRRELIEEEEAVINGLLDAMREQEALDQRKRELLIEGNRLGMSDRALGDLLGMEHRAVAKLRSP